jgi:23S rRNA pseudouridine1911/1915/1917 synthase
MLNVIFEDNHLLVLSKIGNLATQPSPTSDDSLEMQAKAYIKDKYQKPGNVYLHAIHRIDKPVSGIVVFAKTSKALSRLQASIRNKTTKKIYRAWVEGMLPVEGFFEDYLIHGDHIAIAAKSADDGAKRCRLSYKVLKKESKKTLVEIELETGRYHQIRAQFGFRGHPIIGDKKYGSQTSYETILLHHTSFSIQHPVSNEVVTFESLPSF